MKVITTCSLCYHFDSNRGECVLHNIETYAQNAREPIQCQKDGAFLRDMNVQYSYYNYLDENGLVSSEYIENLSKLPVDENGIPLFVLTKKGIERAIPAYPGLNLKSHHLHGVKREFTYQGQRELIYELGVRLAKTRCAELGIELVILKNEENYEGFDEYKNAYRVWR